MKLTTLDILACPTCRGRLTFAGAPSPVILAGELACPVCQVVYPIEKGIPHFVQPDGLTGFNRRFSHLYDWFSWGYRAFSKTAFALIGMDEETGRREITDRLDPHGGSVLEVSIGPGVNLPYLVDRPDVGKIFGLDISPGQLRRCQGYLNRKSWNVDLFLGNAEQLPFQNETFSSVFHIGGINFFNDKKSAIDEMIRVSKTGARILICDENERAAKLFEKTLPGFKKTFNRNRKEIVPPLDYVPSSMLEVRLFEVWKGWFYCIEFRKG